MARRRQPQRKRRTREHVIADLSVNHVERHVLLCGFIVEERRRDYGIDLLMQTFDVNGEVESGFVMMQLKATDRLKVVSRGRSITYRLDRRDLLVWLNEPLPVVLVVYDAKADKAYWLYIQEYFAGRPKLSPGRGGNTFTVHIPRSQVLDQEAVRQFARFRDDILAQAPVKVRDHE